jgi:hypothetical protein
LRFVRRKKDRVFATLQARSALLLGRIYVLVFFLKFFDIEALRLVLCKIPVFSGFGALQKKIKKKRKNGASYV